MILTGSMIAAGVAAGASVFGGIAKSRSARRAAKEQQKELDKQKAANNAYFNKNYYADATQMADNRRALTNAQNALMRNNQAAAGTAAVMGGTNAQAAATKEANNKAIADATSAVSANAQQYKQHVQDSFRNQEYNLNKQQQDVILQRSEANQAAIDGAVNGINTLASSYIAANAGDKDVSFNIGKKK